MKWWPKVRSVRFQRRVDCVLILGALLVLSGLSGCEKHKPPGKDTAPAKPPVASQPAGVPGDTNTKTTTATGAGAGEAPTTAEASEDTGPKFVFTAYNLRNYLRMDRKVNYKWTKSALKPDYEIAQLVKMLSQVKPDILGVSEIGTEDDLADLQNRLREAGIDLPHREHAGGIDDTRFQGLLSRFPIVSRDSASDVSFDLAGTLRYVQRGFLDVTVEVSKDYRLRCIGVHLKSKRDVPEFDQAALRREEAEALRKRVDGILEADPGINLIVYGDFNNTPRDPDIKRTAVKVAQGTYGKPGYLRDIPVSDVDGYRWTHHWRWADIYSRIDYLLVSKGLYPEIVPEKSWVHKSLDYYTASDHRPLVLTIRAVESE